MGEMKKITVNDVPVEQLPEIVRRSIEGSPAEVRVTVEFEAAEQAVAPRRSLRSFMGTGRGLFSTPDEATAFIRDLRDEWDD